MKILTPTTKPFLLLLALGAGGCAVVEWLGISRKSSGSLFPHKLHNTADTGLECINCHRKVETADEPGMPTVKQCTLCHEGIDEKKPPEKQVTVCIDEQGKLKRIRLADLPDEVKFSHKAHVGEKKYECAECHGDIGASGGDNVPEPKVSMAHCAGCHNDEGTAGKADDCSVCHKEISKEHPPRNHEHNWTKVHGEAFRADTERSRERCSLCHTDASCANCHRNEAPENHTNYWRIRGHGVAASIDRENCSVCHQSDSCDRCHSETAPMNHTGSWGAPRDRHCLTCHEPLQEENCNVCHKDTRSHASATPLPAVPLHTPAMNCRQCHGVAQPLPHVDNGDSCVQCHQ